MRATRGGIDVAAVRQDVVLGIDLGTGSVKCVALGRDGAPCGDAAHPYQTDYPQPGFAEQDPDDWWRASAAAVRAALAAGGLDPAAVRCVALCGTAHTPVLLDRNDAVIRPAILWSDQRSGVQVVRLQRTAAAAILEQTLNEPSCTWTLPQLLWVREHEPDALARTRRLLIAKDYLIFRLTGEAVTDPATAASTLLFDLRHGDWSKPLTQLCGLGPDTLPRVVPASAQAGRLTTAAASEFGLVPGTPVAAGTLDSAAELVGTGVLRPGQGLVRLGTAGAVMVVTETPRCCHGALTYPHPLSPFGYNQSGTNACATALQWFRNQLTAASASLRYADLDELAAQVAPGSDGVLFHPYLIGERAPHWDPELRASFTGLTVQHGRAHLARAVLEGVALSLRDCLEALRGQGLTLTDCRLCGGGAGSPLWRQIVCDVLALPGVWVGGGDSASGAALLAAVAAGFFESLPAAVGAAVNTAAPVRPNPAAVACYQALFSTYQSVHDALAPVYRNRPKADCGAEDS